MVSMTDDQSIHLQNTHPDMITPFFTSYDSKPKTKQTAANNCTTKPQPVIITQPTQPIPTQPTQPIKPKPTP